CLAVAGAHVGQRLAIGMVIDDGVGGDQGGANLAWERGQLAESAALVGVVGEHRAEVGAAWRGSSERAQALAENPRELPRRDGDEDLALARSDHLLERELALALDGAPVACREQAAQPPVSGAVGGIADRLEAVRGAFPG